MLDEAEAHLGRGDYGWTQIRLNRAQALRLLGRRPEAEVILRDLVDHCEREYGDPSLQLFAALADLSEVLQEMGSPEYDAIFLRAHEVDDALKDEPDLQDDDEDHDQDG